MAMTDEHQLETGNSASEVMTESFLAEATKPSATAAEAIVRSFVSDDSNIQEGSFHGTSTGNVKVLSLTAFLFGLITAVQWYFGAVVTNSDALVADCHCMLVDALTYFLNIWAELAPPHCRRPLRLAVPAISLSVLASLTVLSALDAKDTIEGNGTDDGVNPWIVWSFGVAGLIFDMISIYAFWRNKKRGALPVNMLAAFMHVGADAIRSMTTTVEGTLLFLYTTWNGSLIDAWSTVVITFAILLGLLYGLFELASDIKAYSREKREVSISEQVIA